MSRPPCDLSSPPRVLHDESTHHASRDAHSAQYRNSHQPLLGYLVIDQLSQIPRLQVARLPLDEKIVVASCLGEIAELVVSEGEVVEALAAALGREAEDLG